MVALHHRRQIINADLNVAAGNERKILHSHRTTCKNGVRVCSILRGTVSFELASSNRYDWTTDLQQPGNEEIVQEYQRALGGEV
jgi:hypothetical protein